MTRTTYVNTANSIAIVPVHMLAGLNQINATATDSITFGSSFDASTTMVATGSGITTNPDNTIAGGTITRLDFYTNGLLQFSVTGFTPVTAVEAGTAFTGGSVPGYDMLISLLAGPSQATGSNANDWIDTGTGNDRVVSGLGDDRVSKFLSGDLYYNGGAGIDTLNLGAENGTVYSQPFAQQFIIDLGLGTAQSPYGGTFTLKGVENVIGTSAADRITGSNADNVIGDGTFDRGADIIDTLGGNDTVKMNIQESGVQADGGTGFDTIFIDTASNFVGNNVFDLENSVANTGVFSRNSFINFENVTFFENEPTVRLEFHGNALANTAIGGTGRDILDGRAGNDTLFGDDGKDDLDGGSGADTMWGGNGNDVLRGGSGADELFGDSGSDFASYYSDGAVNTSLDTSITRTGAAAGDTYSSIENLSGSNTGNDTLVGGAAANKIYGNGGSDIIRGQDGDDLLRGGLGNDTLTGGLGADKFQFDTVLNATTNVDTIASLSSLDKIVLDNDIFTALGTSFTSDEFRSINTGTSFTSVDATDNIIYLKSTGDLYYDRDGSGTTYSAIKFADLAANTTVNFSHFLLIE